MQSLVCPACTRESSPGAYVCAGCNYSFLGERSKPYAKALHTALLATSVLALTLNLGALAYFQAFGHWSLILFFAVASGVPARYYFNRIVGKAARLLYFAETPPETKGWVANDALPIILLALSVLVSASLIGKVTSA